MDFDDDPGPTLESPINGHATLIAHLIAATINNGRGGAGIAPESDLHIWRVLDKDGKGYTSSVTSAISRIEEESKGLGNEVVSMSFGFNREDFLLDLFIATGSDKKLVFVGATGNDGKGEVDYPAAFSPVIAVGSTSFPDENGKIVRAEYSNYGPGIDFVVPIGEVGKDRDGDGESDGVIMEGFLNKAPDYNSYEYKMYVGDGTSFAVALIDAEIAIAISHGARGYNEIYQLLRETTEDVSGGFSEETGYGMARVDLLLNRILPLYIPPPSVSFFSVQPNPCTLEPNKSSCSATIYFIASSEVDVYLYDDFGNGTLKRLGKNPIGLAKINAMRDRPTQVLLLYFWGGKSIVLASQTLIVVSP